MGYTGSGGNPSGSAEEESNFASDIWIVPVVPTVAFWILGEKRVK